MTASKVSRLFHSILEEIQANPVVSHVITGVLLIVFEKMLEVEFVCPCRGIRLNLPFALCYLISPPLAVLLLKCCALGCKCAWQQKCSICLHTLVPFMTWFNILLLDGRYAACASTDWSGTYEATDGGGLMRWCKPDNNSSGSLSYTRCVYNISQASGILLTVVWVPGCYHILCYLDKTRHPARVTQPNLEGGGNTQPQRDLSLIPIAPQHQAQPDASPSPGET